MSSCSKPPTSGAHDFIIPPGFETLEKGNIYRRKPQKLAQDVYG
jgi:hypothetical protein